MRPFAYARATAPEEAIGLLAGDERAMYVGGGTNLVDLMRLGVATPERLVDVSRLPLAGIAVTPAGGLRIGAATRNSDLAADTRVRARYAVLSQAVLAGASGQLRNVATVAGNLLQRTRCAYFQDVTKPCNKREPGSGCPALEGDHRNLAVLGWSERCVATHPSDMAVALAAVDAVVHVQGAGGPRAIPLGDFHRLAGATPERDTVLEHGELVTAIELPPCAGHSAYRKVRERTSFAFAIVSVAAVLETDDGTVRDAALVLGGVAHKPWRAREAEDALRGAPATRESFEHAADATLASARPLRDNAYKIPLARNLIARTLCDLAEEAR